MTVANPSSRSTPLRYPSLSLGESIAKVRRLYDEAHQRRMSREEIAKLLGYTGLNGASINTISNLGRYGLLDGRGDAVRVSDDAVILLVELPDSPERQAALRRTALNPELFQELSENFSGVVPGENAVRIRLERNGFPRKQAEVASRAFCETMALVAAEGGAYNQPQVSSEPGDRGGSMNTDIQSAPQGAAPVRPANPPAVVSFLASSDLPPVTFPLPRGNAVEIRLRSKISRAEFERLKPILMSLLEMSVVDEEGGD